MALTGFNPDEVKTSIRSVKNAYDNLIKALGDDMQTQFVGGMADKWACKNAQDFFQTAFKPSVDGLITSSNKIFQSVVDSMNSAATAWAQQTKSTYARQSFSLSSKKMDISSIKENISGVRGIDVSSANAVANKLTTIASSAKSALASAKQAVQNCGFIGGGQAQSLINSLGTIQNKIDKATEEITAETKKAIDATVTNYSDTEGKISQAFSTGGN